MDIVDCHSYLEPDHPVYRHSQVGYLIAPAIGSSLDLLGFQSSLGETAGSRSLGGLLPVHGPDDDAFLRSAGQPWWRALLLTPFYTPGVTLDASQVHDRLMQAAHLPILIECGIEGYSRPIHLERFLASTPARSVILTHGGQLNISGSHLSAAADLFKAYPHTLLETSGIYRQDFLEEMLEALGPERIIYGSGFPWMDERLELERVRILRTTEEAKALMLGGNARRVFGLSG